MPSAFIPSVLRYSAMPLARQPMHHRYVHPGPLVLGTDPLKYLRPRWIGTELSHACYPRGNFYPLSDGNSILYRRITKSYFRICSTCQSRSQAPLCLYTLRMVANHSEGTFERLRYSLGGDRPSQTAHLKLSDCRITVNR